MVVQNLYGKRIDLPLGWLPVEKVLKGRLRPCVMRPPSGGAIIGAINAGHLIVAVARTKSCISTVRRTIDRPM